MEAIEPLISSGVCGPSGIAHLPRLWLKILLHAVGRLPEGYRHGHGGFDEAICERFGVDRDAFVAYIESERPEYLALERWFLAHAKTVAPNDVAAWNLYVRTANLRPELAAERRTQFRIEDVTFAHGITLNDLDDWSSMHARLVTTDRGEDHAHMTSST